MKLDPLEITDLYSNIGFAEGIIISLHRRIPEDSRPDDAIIEDSIKKLKEVISFFDKLLIEIANDK